MQIHLIRSKIIAFFQCTGLGIVLSLVQFGLLFLGIPRLDTTTVIIMGLVLYFIVPGLAGLLVSRRRESASTGTVMGFVTGLTCATIIMLVLIIAAIIAINAPPRVTSGRFVPIPVAFLAYYFIALAFALNFLGVLLALIGGGLGGFIGGRWMARRS